MKLKSLGYFRELRHGNDDGPSLSDAVRNAHKAPRDEGKIASYLRQSPTIVATTHFVDDVIAPQHTEIAVPHIHTDGTWEWPEDLAYYVETYHIALPPEFVEHVRGQNYQPPRLTKEERITLGDELLGW
jgi:hypothetical protein